MTKNIMLPNFPSDWMNLMKNEFSKEYFLNIQSFLESEKLAGKTIYPENKDIFAAFHKTPLDSVSVVILGQDPYHGPWQAHWLSFSVQEWVKIPPSLRNIYKELENEYPWYLADSGSLMHWAEQGVLLLNSILTVEAKNPASHAKIWWETFTNNVLQKISDSQNWVIFVLWGAYAQKKKEFIDHDKHCILESAHPSPFSAHRGFLWNNHFKKINEILKKQWKEEIIW